MPRPITETADIVTRCVDGHGDRFRGRPYFLGHCPVCGADTPLFCTADVASARETLICPACNTTGRYRSLALGLLDEIAALAGVRVADLAALAHATPQRPLSVYDTQVPFAYERAAYPIPELLAAASWIRSTPHAMSPDVRGVHRWTNRPRPGFPLRIRPSRHSHSPTRRSTSLSRAT